jgi:transposase
MVHFMTTTDARSLPAAAQEDLRRKAVKAVLEGMTQVEAARIFGVSRIAVNNWIRRHREGGSRALKAGKRGRPSEPRLATKERREVVRLITAKCPDQLALPFALWTREAVQMLLSTRFGMEVSVWTVGRYLRSWGMSPQKPLRRAFEKDPVAVRRWLKDEYPAIRAEAKRLGAEIQWGDEMGLRSDHQTGRTWGLKGQTPIVPGTGQRFSTNLISTVTNRGKLAFMVFRESFTVPVFLRFLKRLVRNTRKTIFLVIDRHPVHKSARVKKWVATLDGKLQIFFLPSYSPELNPDELLNQDVKSNALGRRRPTSAAEMEDDVRSYLRATQKRPSIVQSYFNEANVRYAAG